MMQDMRRYASLRRDMGESLIWHCNDDRVGLNIETIREADTMHSTKNVNTGPGGLPHFCNRMWYSEG